jgi:phosphoserine phosphatase RsbU/P
MLSPKNALGIFLYVNVVSWLLLLGIKLIAFFGFSGQNVNNVNFYLKGLLLNFFLLAIFFYFSSKVEKLKEIDFVELLTNLFVMGLITNTCSLIIQFINSTLETPPVSENSTYLINLFYHLNISLVAIYLTQAFFYWKKMILHQVNENLLKTWNAFEYILLISLLFNFFEFDLSHLPFSVALAVLLILGLVLSVNLKWVAYLNSKEKWQSILLLLFIAVFAYYFFYTVISHVYNPYYTTQLMHSVYILAMFVFVIFYSIFSLLVILFNLPTGAVFERKVEEIINFQRLAQSLQAGEDETHVYEVLLDSAINSVTADAAWLEIKDEQGHILNTINREIDLPIIEHIRRLIRKNRLVRIVDDTFARNQSKHDPLTESLAEYDFGSILTAPLVANEKSLGSLTLLKKVKDGFDEEKKELVQTFARQASLSIENFRLLTKTIEAERYKEELKIAQRIQKSLLPIHFNATENFEIEGFSESAHEVGGDYYDFYQTKQGKIIIIVGDVSGKGTTAAFHMAQMKGIFQTLVQMELTAEDFLNLANQALSNCLAKSSFMTVTLVMIDTHTRQVEIARAGHCPTLYYNAKVKQSLYFQGDGLGLGIIRKGDYRKFLATQFFACAKNDLLLLYTDGIVEAKDEEGEEFGYDRLQTILETNAQAEPKHIIEKIITELDHFRADNYIQDDHTLVVVKCR